VLPVCSYFLICFLFFGFGFRGATRPVGIVIGTGTGHKPIARHLFVACMAAMDLLMHLAQ
jgi:hypothetical protein